MQWKFNNIKVKKQFKAVSLIETILSLTLIMLAFGIMVQTFVWSKDTKYQKIKQRIEKRNLYYENVLMNKY